MFSYGINGKVLNVIKDIYLKAKSFKKKQHTRTHKKVYMHKYICKTPQTFDTHTHNLSDDLKKNAFSKINGCDTS